MHLINTRSFYFFCEVFKVQLKAEPSKPNINLGECASTEVYKMSYHLIVSIERR